MTTPSTGTLSREGAIGGREFAVRSEDGQAAALVCLACSTETAPGRGAFAAHKCATEKAAGGRQKPAAEAATGTTTKGEG